MDDIYKNVEEYNPNKKREILTLFDDMIADMLSNTKLNPIVTELFVRGRKLNKYLVFMSQSYFKVAKRSQTKQQTLFYYENPKQKRTSTNYV